MRGKAARLVVNGTEYDVTSVRYSADDAVVRDGRVSAVRGRPWEATATFVTTGYFRRYVWDEPFGEVLYVPEERELEEPITRFETLGVDVPDVRAVIGPCVRVLSFVCGHEDCAESVEMTVACMARGGR